jgi:RimJ/RimL family protein N-acetyltransferase
LINLLKFNDSDCSQLISEIPDARFLLQWAGPKYSYPLDDAQLTETITNTIGEKPSYKVFKAIKSDTLETVGHIQLMNIDYDIERCFLGRVLVFKKYRHKGYGKELVQEAIRIAFEQIGMNEIILGVFDFNTAAIELYKKIGFSKFHFVEGARQFQNESWNLIRMKLCKNKSCEPIVSH